MSVVSEMDILPEVRELSPYEFEKFVAALWELQGWATEVTEKTGDKGIDVEATHRVIDVSAKIQAKRLDDGNSIGVGKVQRYTIRKNEDYNLSIIVTSGSFTK